MVGVTGTLSKSMKARATTLLSALAVGGCQLTADAPDVSAPPAPPAASAPFASNELNRLGRKDLDAGNNGLAADHFLAATEQDRNDALAWIGLAAAYDNLKRFDLADQAYAQAIRISGPTLSIINNRGYSYLLRGDRARALAEFERALSLDPGNLVILNNIRLVRSGELPNKRVPP